MAQSRKRQRKTPTATAPDAEEQELEAMLFGGFTWNLLSPSEDRLGGVTRAEQTKSYSAIKIVPGYRGGAQGIAGRL